jgi:hypothetical protein
MKWKTRLKFRNCFCFSPSTPPQPELATWHHVNHHLLPPACMRVLARIIKPVHPRWASMGRCSLCDLGQMDRFTGCYTGQKCIPRASCPPCTEILVEAQPRVKLGPLVRNTRLARLARKYSLRPMMPGLAGFCSTILYLIQIWGQPMKMGGHFWLCLFVGT